jgi:hypothetical protein
MTPFEEADARLAAMHGYAPMALARIEAKLDALETLVRGLVVALRGGAVGKWS